MTGALPGCRPPAGPARLRPSCLREDKKKCRLSERTAHRQLLRKALPGSRGRVSARSQRHAPGLSCKGRAQQHLTSLLPRHAGRQKGGSGIPYYLRGSSLFPRRRGQADRAGNPSPDRPAPPDPCADGPRGMPPGRGHQVQPGSSLPLPRLLAGAQAVRLPAGISPPGDREKDALLPGEGRVDGSLPVDGLVHRCRQRLTRRWAPAPEPRKRAHRRRSARPGEANSLRRRWCSA